MNLGWVQVHIDHKTNKEDLRHKCLPCRLLELACQLILSIKIYTFIESSDYIEKVWIQESMHCKSGQVIKWNE